MTYRHTKVVDDDVRQGIALVLREHMRTTRQTIHCQPDLLQALGELYMRERWGVKGDMGVQAKQTHHAQREREAAQRTLRDALDAVTFQRREARIWRSAAEGHAKRAELLKETIASLLAENPWRRAARLTLADARTTLRRVLLWRGYLGGQ